MLEEQRKNPKFHVHHILCQELLQPGNVVLRVSDIGLMDFSIDETFGYSELQVFWFLFFLT